MDKPPRRKRPTDPITQARRPAELPYHLRTDSVAEAARVRQTRLMRELQEATREYSKRTEEANNADASKK